MSVKLYVYDLSNGMAAALSAAIIGKHIDGVWHTSVVYEDVEMYYGQGVFKAVPGKTHLGAPLKIIDMGKSEVPFDMLNDWLVEISPEWTAEKYNLLKHNCNDFSNLLCEFLVGKGIPREILGVAETVAQTQFGQMFGAMPAPV